MQNKLLNTNGLENVLKAHWTEFIDSVQLMRTILEHVHDTSFTEIKQAEIPKKETKVSVTKTDIKTLDGLAFAVPMINLWVEFTVPKTNGVVIGTVILTLDFDGEYWISDSFGTHFIPET